MKNATTTTKKSASKEGKGGDSLSHLIDARIKELNDCRGETLPCTRAKTAYKAQLLRCPGRELNGRPRGTLSRRGRIA